MNVRSYIAVVLVVCLVLATALIVVAMNQPAPVPDPVSGQIVNPGLMVPPVSGAAAQPTSAAGTTLLARIRSCSPAELDRIADLLSGAEAVALYSQLTPADRTAVLGALPPPLLARKVRDLLGVPEAFVHPGKVTAVTAGLIAVADGTAPAAPQRAAIRFATSLDEQGGPRLPRSSFRPNDRRIYACIDGETDESVGDPGVIVRWVEERTGMVVMLRWQPFAINSPRNFVFYEVKDAWPPGTYRVGFHRIANAVRLIGEGTYVVAE